MCWLVHCDPDIVAAVISIILLVITFIYAWMVMRNFGRGLKDQSTSTLGPFQLFVSKTVLQSHGSKRLQAQSTVHTLRCLYGPAGWASTKQPSHACVSTDLDSVCEYPGSMSILHMTYRRTTTLVIDLPVTPPEIYIVPYSARLCCCWASPKRSILFPLFYLTCPHFHIVHVMHSFSLST